MRIEHRHQDLRSNFFVLVTNTLDNNTLGTLRNAISFVNTNVNPLSESLSPTDVRFSIGTVSSAQTIALPHTYRRLPVGDDRWLDPKSRRL
jgi:hypothetical protein